MGGGGGVQSVRFFVFVFKSSTYFTFYRGGPMVLLQRKLHFSKDPEGVQHFPGGPTFPGVEVQTLISIETHPGGLDLLSPLWIRT